MGEGPLPTFAPSVSRGGGALRLVMVRVDEGPGPGSARGVVFVSSTSVADAEGVIADCVGGCSAKKFIGLREAVMPLKLRSGRLLRNGIIATEHG
jgi:hypothetical protein